MQKKVLFDFIPQPKVTRDIDSGYSDYWRKNKSTLEELELANGLRALRKVVGYIGANVKAVEWAGMSEPGMGKTILPVDIALGEYPIPPGKMDALVGMAIHESFHCTEWSDWVRMNAEDIRSKLPPKHKEYFNLLLETGEDIYLEGIINRNSIMWDYVKKARVMCKPKNIRDVSSTPSPERLFGIWAEEFLEGLLPDKIHPDYDRPLRLLRSHVADIVACGDSKSVSERAKYRFELYGRIWEDISGIIGEWKSDYADVGWMSEYSDGSGGALSPELAKGVEVALASNAEDITALVDDAYYKNRPMTSIRTIFRDATQPCSIPADNHLARKLQLIFQAYWRKTERVNRGLKGGRIDKRRLHRVPYSPYVFQIKEPVVENAWSICVLLDASWSMQDRDWRIAESVCYALTKALMGYKDRLAVFGYHENHGICEVHRLVQGNRFFTITPMGRTPAGQAIIAASLKMPKGYKKLLIHVTDGECNIGIDVKDAIDYCDRNDIDLITLGCGFARSAQLQEQYGATLQLISSIDELPITLQKLLKQKLLGKTRRRRRNQDTDQGVDLSDVTIID